MNPHRGEAEVKLNGSYLKLRLSMNGLAELEDLTGITMTQLGQMDGADMIKHWGIKFLRALLYVGIRGGQPKWKGTLENIGDLMRPDEMAGYYTSAVQALTRSLGGEEKNEPTPPEAEKPAGEIKANSDGAGTTSLETPQPQESALTQLGI